MLFRGLMIVLVGFVLAGCETYTTPRYSVSADNIVAMKSLSPAKVNVGPFEEPKKFEPGCRAAGPISAGNLGFAAYIQKALSDELKIAGIYDSAANVTLTGALDSLAYSSSAGTWDIALTVTSSNGKSISVQESHSFSTAFAAVTACQRSADAYFPAVQNLLEKLVKSPEFRSLVQPLGRTVG